MHHERNSERRSKHHLVIDFRSQLQTAVTQSLAQVVLIGLKLSSLRVLFSSYLRGQQLSTISHSSHWLVLGQNHP